jgi:hypothetical protein
MSTLIDCVGTKFTQGSQQNITYGAKIGSLSVETLSDSECSVAAEVQIFKKNLKLTLSIQLEDQGSCFFLINGTRYNGTYSIEGHKLHALGEDNDGVEATLDVFRGAWPFGANTGANCQYGSYPQVGVTLTPA